MSLYILDSNFFIEAHRAYYPLDVMVSFWEKVAQLSDQGVLKSIDKVKKELYDNSSHEDELKTWCKKHLPQNFFLNTTIAFPNYQKIAQWANAHQQYKKRAKEEFLTADLADPWLVAYAMNTNKDIIIVTQEKSAPNAVKRIKIPEVCNHFGVRYLNAIDMLRQLKETI